MFGSQTLTSRNICRAMLVLWVVAVVVVSILVGRSTKTEQSGNLIAFLFTGAVPLESLLKVTPPAPPTVVPAPLPTPKLAEPAEPEPEVLPDASPAYSPWQPMPRGRALGKGELQIPQVTLLDNGSIQVLIDYTGKLGQITSFKVARPQAVSVDLHGVWNRMVMVDKRYSGKAVLSRIQVAEHKNYVRVSGIDSAGQGKLEAITEFSPTQIRITFTHAIRN